MTPRKELFIKVKEALDTLPELELVDLFRNQFGNQHFTAALIRINKINWETMTENKQEGNCTIDVLFYTKDGWMDQHKNTGDPEHGLMEIDVIDTIVEKLQFLSGDLFKPLQLIEEEDEEQERKGIMGYRISFDTLIYRRINYPYSNRKLTLNPQ